MNSARRAADGLHEQCQESSRRHASGHLGPDFASMTIGQSLLVDHGNAAVKIIFAYIHPVAYFTKKGGAELRSVTAVIEPQRELVAVTKPV